MELLGLQSVVDFVLDFVLDASRRCAVGSMKVLTVSLRSLLQYLFAVSVVDRDLRRCRRWRDGGRVPCHLLPARTCLPPCWPACDRSTPLGLRDYAVLLLMARLGLRSAGSATASPIPIRSANWSTTRVSRTPNTPTMTAAMINPATATGTGHTSVIIHGCPYPVIRSHNPVVPGWYRRLLPPASAY